MNPLHILTALTPGACREELAEVVRLQERGCLEMWAALGAAPEAVACAAPVGGTLTPAQMVEAAEDVW